MTRTLASITGRRSDVFFSRRSERARCVLTTVHLSRRPTSVAGARRIQLARALDWRCDKAVTSPFVEQFLQKVPLSLSMVAYLSRNDDGTLFSCHRKLAGWHPSNHRRPAVSSQRTFTWLLVGGSHCSCARSDGGKEISVADGSPITVSRSR